MLNSADILVIDDEQMIINAVSKICTLENYSVNFANSIISGLDKISKNYYPIILCDIMMPDGDGFEILNEVMEKKIDTIVIMMTGYSTVENAINSLYKGAVDFIPKPFTADELLNSLSRAVKHKKIIEKQKLLSMKNGNDELLFVTCPAKYLRLGYASWVFIENEGSAVIGICDLYTKTIDTIIEFELMNDNEEIGQGMVCASIKDNEERIHKVFAPITGRVVEVNNKVKAHPNLLEKDPYFGGWLYRVIPSNIDYEVRYLIPCSSDRV